MIHASIDPKRTNPIFKKKFVTSLFTKSLVLFLAALIGFEQTFIQTAQAEPNQSYLGYIFPQGLDLARDAASRAQAFSDWVDQGSAEYTERFDVERERAGAQADISTIEAGRASELSRDKRDPFHLQGQSVIEHNNGNSRVRDLADLNLRSKAPSYDHLQVSIDTEGSLLFTATSLGLPVRTHVITGLDAVAQVGDAELLYVIGRDGRLHVINMNTATQLLFTAPIPVVKNQFKIEQSGRGGVRYKMALLSELAEPFPEMEPTPENMRDYVLPTVQIGEEERVIYTEGDLVVWEVDAHEQKTHFVGVFSRVATHTSVARASTWLAYIAFLANPSDVPRQVFAKFLQQMDLTEDEARMLRDVQSAMDPISLRAALSLSTAQQQDLLATGKVNLQRAGRATKLHTFESLMAGWSRMRGIAEARVRELEGAAIDSVQKRVDRLKRALAERNLAALEQDLDPSSSVLAELDTAAKENGRTYRITGIADSASAAALRLPGVGRITNHRTIVYRLQQTEVLVGEYTPSPKSLIMMAKVVAPFAVGLFGYLYAYGIPEILLHEQYRNLLFWSTMGTLSIVPLADVISIGSVPTMKGLSAVLKAAGLAPQLQRFLELKAAQWGEMNSYQRICSFTARLYAEGAYPLFHRIADIVFSRDLRIAVSQKLPPLYMDPVTGDIKQTRGEALNKVATTKRARDAFSYKLALMVAASEAEIPADVLMLVMSGQLSPVDVARVQEDPAKVLQMERVTYELASEFNARTLAEQQKLYGSADPEVLADAYALARTVATRIRASGGFDLWKLDAKRRFTMRVYDALARVANFGVADYNLLKTGVATVAIATMVRIGFLQDQPYTDLANRVSGKRADMGNPELLSAQAGEPLSTHPNHLVHMGQNIFAHFVSAAAARMLVFLRVSARSEKRYNPTERPEYELAESPESFMASAKAYMNAFDMRLSNIGGNIKRRAASRFNTIQMGALTFIGLTMAIKGLSLPDSALRYFFYYTVGFIGIGICWDLIEGPMNRVLNDIGDRRTQYENELGRLKDAVAISDPARTAAARDAVLKFYEKRFGKESTEYRDAAALAPAELLRHGYNRPAIFTTANAVAANMANIFAVVSSTYVGGLIFTGALTQDFTVPLMMAYYGMYRTYIYIAGRYFSKEAWTFFASEIAKWRDPQDSQNGFTCARAFLPWTPLPK